MVSGRSFAGRPPGSGQPQEQSPQYRSENVDGEQGVIQISSVASVSSHHEEMVGELRHRGESDLLVGEDVRHHRYRQERGTEGADLDG
jgi:hypothetical protein